MRAVKGSLDIKAVGAGLLVLKMAKSVAASAAASVAVTAVFYQRLMDIADGVSTGDELWDLYDEAIRAAKGDRAAKRKRKGGAGKDQDKSNGKTGKVGENGTKTNGSKTTGRNGKTERVDVENLDPGQRDGNLHYHESNNTKWRYDTGSGKFIDPTTGKPAPRRIQNKLKEPWVKKAIDKALEILGEQRK